MRPHLLLARTTLRGQTDGTITPGSNAWLDLEPYQHVVAWLSVAGVNAGGGTVQLGYQTAVLPQEELFVTMSGPATTVPFTPAVGITVTPFYKDLLTVPLARFFRWQLVASGTSSAWDIDLEIQIVGAGSAAGPTGSTKAPVRAKARRGAGGAR